MIGKVSCTLGVLTIATLLSGCGIAHTWAPGPRATGDLGMVSGRCKMESIEKEAGHALGVGIAGAIQRQDLYNACMEANGFVAAADR
jgi:hypothetical protein